MKIKKATRDFVKKIADKALVKNANSTSCVLLYQPIAPAKLARFKAKEK